jgi:hypothetical protein
MRTADPCSCLANFGIDESSNKAGLDLEFAGFSENRVTLVAKLEF